MHTAFAMVIALVLAAPGAVAAQSIPPNRAADAAAIRAEIERISQAFVDKDRQTLAATHGSDWRGFTPWSGHVIRGRDGYMNEATFEPGMPTGQGMVGFRISDFDVVFYGETAVASFVMTNDVVNGTDKGTQKLTLVDVFHKDQNRWVQVASNTSLHPDEIDQMMSRRRSLGPGERAAVLQAREAVWRAWFAGDADALGALVPPELITIEPGSDTFGTRASNLENARGFPASGAKLTRLVFPRTEVQAYGATVILYTTYELDLTTRGRVSTERGTATEVFVRQNGRWVNTGWQLSRLPASAPPSSSSRPSDPQTGGAGGDSLSGKWGRDGQVFLELVFDGKSAVSGTAIWRSGQREQRSPIRIGTFDSKSGLLRLEGETSGLTGTATAFVIEGMLEKDTIRGTYKVENDSGKFEFRRM